jgi:hypothetical protein
MRNNPEIKQLIAQVLWDVNIPVEEAMSIIADKKKGEDRRRLIVKLLKSYNWYTLLEIFTIEEMTDILNDSKIIDSLWPDSLKEKYINARKILQ